MNTVAVETQAIESSDIKVARPGVWKRLARNPSVLIGGVLLLLIAQVATGLVADDEIATTGPLNRYVSSALGLRATSWHNTFGQYLIITLVVLHIATVLFYLFKKQRNLIAPMWHGDKPLAPGTPASADGWAQRVLAALLIALAFGVSWWIARLGA